LKNEKGKIKKRTKMKKNKKMMKQNKRFSQNSIWAAAENKKNGRADEVRKNEKNNKQKLVTAIRMKQKISRKGNNSLKYLVKIFRK
jgi:hypothetical protein